MSQKTFEQHIKEKMEGYAPKSCPDIWSQLESALDAEAKQKRKFPWWIAGVAASLILMITAGLLTYNFNNNDVRIASLPIEGDTIRHIVDTQVRPELPLSNPIATLSSIAPTVATPVSTKRTAMSRSAAINNSGYTNLYSDQPESGLFSENKESNTESTQPLIGTKSATRTNTTTTTTTTTTQTKTTTYSHETIRQKKSVEKPLLLSLATNNSVVNISQRSNSVTPLYKSSDRRLMGLMQLANSQSIPRTELQHYQPITVSLTARKRLAERFSIETGLSYSYLYSRSKTNIGVERKESQELHYIGVPVSGIIDILKGKQWSIYAKAGGQIDVNIAGKWNEKWSQDGREFANSTVTDLEKKPQFSAHLALGFGYKLTKKVQLSLEPGATYYFDNESEVENIYKERPMSGSINLALSYLF